ncbi:MULTISPECIES: hypothetical protein [Chryseobacterium]|uniref:Uncharacterized protein n=1 Tax=Chryseobacterium piscium TaxID=333702 RepID=A0A3D9BK37_9FLAO|nr:MULTISPECIES: hypothetical protein [Chryseobacterium]REC53874.1 hypothetical protein DRF62_11975 [Chryseobacterium piscium]
MKNKNLFFIFLGLLPAILLFTFFLISKSHENDIVIYNPYSKEMIVKIDDEQHIIKPKEEFNVSLEFGKHKVYSYCDKVLVNANIQVDNNILEKGGFLNLSNQPVYLWTTIYSNPTDQEIAKELFQDDSIEIDNPYENLQIDTILVDSYKIVGPIKRFSPKDLLIEKQWYYSITKPFQGEIKNRDRQSINVKENISKLFSEEDLVNYWIELVNE